MTERAGGFVVTLKDDIREEETADVLRALSMVRGVLTVKPVDGDMALHMAEDRVRHRYYMAMHDAVRGVFGESTTDKTRQILPPAPRLGRPFAAMGLLLLLVVAVVLLLVSTFFQIHLVWSLR